MLVTVLRAMVAAAWLLPATAPAKETMPWMDAAKSPDERATLAVAAMTLEEKLSLLHGPMAGVRPASGSQYSALPPDAIPGAGYIPGIPRLHIPALYETDAGLGVANSQGMRLGDVATALPAGLALAATFNPQLAYAAGALVGEEAHAKGFNVLLGGGVNLTRDPRNGRNFEYLGEDPWLGGVMAAQEVRGTQDQHVISTVKHFALNANETNRHTLDAKIDKQALRESDLLAFEIAVESGRPGAVMCSYNKVNGAYACGNDWLLNDVLKIDWAYKGWVMSDWGAVHATEYALTGLDQESGEQLDNAAWFGARLHEAIDQGVIPMSRVDDMATRIVRSLLAVGVVEHPPVKRDIDYSAHAAIALDIAREGIVLLKNAGDILPLSPGIHRIAIIGGHANVGVLSGGGSSQVTPSNGPPVHVPEAGDGAMINVRNETYFPSAPFSAIQIASPTSQLIYDNGAFPEDAAALAAHADLAIVFVTRHELEGYDIPNLNLPYGQNELVDAVASANPHTIVVLETGNPVAMPWLGRVSAVLAAWYPGQEGGQAIADVLFGAVNPSGRLPITFPTDDQQTIRPRLPNLRSENLAQVSVDYTEGADIGYRWYDRQHRTPLFAFGFGLSYTHYDYDKIKAIGGTNLTISFEVRNTGSRAGADVAQVYLTSGPSGALLRLVGFQRVGLNPGEHKRVTLIVDNRLLGHFDETRRAWFRPRGVYTLQVGRSAANLLTTVKAAITAN